MLLPWAFGVLSLEDSSMAFGDRTGVGTLSKACAGDLAVPSIAAAAFLLLSRFSSSMVGSGIAG